MRGVCVRVLVAGNLGGTNILTAFDGHLALTPTLPFFPPRLYVAPFFFRQATVPNTTAQSEQSYFETVALCHTFAT